VTDAIDTVREAILDPTAKPRLRGVSHQWAFFVSLITGTVLVIVAPSGKATWAALIYSVAVAGLFGVSALYHRINWRSPAARARMRRLDHTMIFVLIAGTYTPFALLALHGTLATIILIVVWGGALLGAGLKLVWLDAPKWVIAVVYIALGWVAVAAMPQMVDHVGLIATLLVGLGGVLYTLGAVAYARQSPNPVPGVFGYHEVFHVLVIAAAAIHYAVVAAYVLPRSG
jgi:hemolysin III